MLNGKERLEDPAFRRLLRLYQWPCLLPGKARATTLPNQRQASIWQPAADLVERQ